MQQFVVGTLIENEEGATYEGVVYDRFLKLQISTGEILSIFDPFRPISTGVPINDQYEMILASLPVPGSIYTDKYLLPFNENEKDIWKGDVIEVSWVGNLESYRCIRSDEFEREIRILLTTTRGNILLPCKYLATSPFIGQTIWWNSMRLDLRAIL